MLLLFSSTVGGDFLAVLVKTETAAETLDAAWSSIELRRILLELAIIDSAAVC